MERSLVNVPVVLYVWTRPDKLKRVFDVVRKAKPSYLFLVSDGAINGSQDQMNLIYESRKIVNVIDWDCEVHRLYYDENNGLFNMFKIVSDYVFSKVDRYVFLEDDVVPSLSFFSYCEELLEKYKDDMRINMVSGMNHLGIYNKPNSDYFFTRGAASIWGFAIWKRTYEQFYRFDFTKDEYVFDMLINNTKNWDGFKKLLFEYKTNENYGGHIAGPEFFLGLSAFIHSQLSIIPTRNMICNIGYGEGACNFNNKKLLTRKIARLFDMETFEYNFPIKHPAYVIEDNVYKDKVLRALGRRGKMLDTFERILRQVWHKEILQIFYKNS